MLAWRVEEVESPYGTVATLHWAVPDDAEDGQADPRSPNPTALQVELESAEDQLGAVLWNSNPAALNYLHTHIFMLPRSKDSEAATPRSETLSSSPLEGKNIVELGAGVGCLGIALAMAGARVAVTDMKELLPLMAHNVKLNERRVQARSHGVGYCAALQWKWGPTVATNVYKQLHKEMNVAMKSSGSSAEEVAFVSRVMSAMVESLEKPSDSLEQCSGALQSAASKTASTLPYHYVIMCDALYGNPKDWPALLYTLTELLATNPDGCVVVNFCEQRVDNVEGAFLKALHDENQRVHVPASQRDTVGDPLWTAVMDSALQCVRMAAARKNGSGMRGGAASTSAAAAELHSAREQAVTALLNYVLVQRRGPYRWTYTTEVIAEAQSELNMVVRASRIRWTLEGTEDASADGVATPVGTRHRPREAVTDAHHSHTTALKKVRR
ncbi:hypothetical protein ABL78_4323 [Leptomonas seymouri]|uniref:Methyltransferase n=1 Tax=Leptomonas seymouri TaxID=5684 RepID=A0A0N1HWR5_LEPSE|nr:hypothetical protein ABL78_4323 [Leptomonas seymouri]|eukprot:KPI86594.1 hypothetical protein ABL78_4323 [Leptomonas seymouri]